jgi:hypothetical protein
VRISYQAIFRAGFGGGASNTGWNKHKKEFLQMQIDEYG